MGRVCVRGHAPRRQALRFCAVIHKIYLHVCTFSGTHYFTLCHIRYLCSCVYVRPATQRMHGHVRRGTGRAAIDIYSAKGACARVALRTYTHTPTDVRAYILGQINAIRAIPLTLSFALPRVCLCTRSPPPARSGLQRHVLRFPPYNTKWSWLILRNAVILCNRIKRVKGNTRKRALSSALLGFLAAAGERSGRDRQLRARGSFVSRPALRGAEPPATRVAAPKSLSRGE